MDDVIVIGGGIGGLSSASEIASTHRVTLIEREDTLGYHSTGRSAAVYIEPLLSDLICRLTQLSRLTFESPGRWELPEPLLRPRGDLRLASRAQEADLEEYLERWLPLCPSLERVRGDELLSYLPGLSSTHDRIGVWNPEVFDIDVHALSEAYRKEIKRRGGQVRTATEFLGATHGPRGWALQSSSGPLEARWLVNAAGAWADSVAQACGVEPLGLQPKRRTIAQIAPWSPAVLRWPMVHDALGGWYLKPEGSRVLVSPADQTPHPAVDARPDEQDVALAIDLVEQSFEVKVERVLGRWAGLRTFAPDALPVIGPDAGQPHYIWCAGQGGCGIQTSAAVARLTRCSLTEEDLPDEFERAGINLSSLGPGRLR